MAKRGRKKTVEFIPDFDIQEIDLPKGKKVICPKCGEIPAGDVISITFKGLESKHCMKCAAMFIKEHISRVREVETKFLDNIEAINDIPM